MTASGGAPVVTLYGRPGCHLCEEARERLLHLQSTGAQFELREVDIESDERLLRSMLELIPVVEVEGERVSELLVEPDAVLRRIDTLSR
jgi:glutaredoxin